ncbi:MAG: polyhydroxyalkanoate synthesis regulator DNA-binding domain-containing protein [Deltaproteobacteria bacterium]|nr:polyhydroxyalkanoate synthesis regulator DNA-binding domain-containing protein [Deltaproteobacteria bacterium]
MARTIRRYPNRRLYDEVEHRYVALEDLLAVVQHGETIEVFDSETGEVCSLQVLLSLLSRHIQQSSPPDVATAWIHALLHAKGLPTDALHAAHSSATQIPPKTLTEAPVRPLDAPSPLSRLEERVASLEQALWMLAERLPPHDPP